MSTPETNNASNATARPGSSNLGCVVIVVIVIAAVLALGVYQAFLPHMIEAKLVGPLGEFKTDPVRCVLGSSKEFCQENDRGNRNLGWGIMVSAAILGGLIVWGMIAASPKKKPTPPVGRASGESESDRDGV